MWFWITSIYFQIPGKTKIGEIRIGNKRKNREVSEINWDWGGCKPFLAMYNPWQHQKNMDFLMSSAGIERKK